MKKRILNILCIALCCAIVCGVVSVSAEADNDVGLEIAFDKQIYVPGDIAEVTLSLTGLTDEVAANKMLGVFEAHIEFDADEMAFIATDDEEAELTSQWADGIIVDGDTTVFQVPENPEYKNNIVLAFDKLTGIPITCDDDGKLPIAKIRFYVKECTDGKLTVKFNDEVLEDGREAFTSVVAVLKVDGHPVRQYNCTNGDAAEADVKDFLFDDATAYIDESGNITASVEAGSASGSAYLIVKLYNAETGMLAAPVRVNRFIGRATIEETIFEDIPTDGTYKIEYYLWDCGDNGIMGMKPLAQKVTTTVVAQ